MCIEKMYETRDLCSNRLIECSMCEKNHFEFIRGATEKKRDLTTKLSSVCASNECKYGQCEIIDINTYKCHCNEGFSGENCDQLRRTLNPCESNPCYAESVCVNKNNASFSCECSEGRSGAQCNGHKSPCKCQNGATCSFIGPNTHVCLCPVGFGGYLCQYELSDFNSCMVSSCQNGGTCLIDSSCKCPKNYYGQLCEHYDSLMPEVELVRPKLGAPLSLPRAAPSSPINVCYTGMCLNGGTCLQVFDNLAICVCPSGYTGIFCNLIANLLSTTASTTTTTTAAQNRQLCSFANVCKNGGICYQSSDFFQCSCPAGYSGVLCEVASTFCSSSPCKNGGVCNSSTSSCTCANNYKGQFCQLGLICNPDPCQTGQICINVDGAPKCYTL